MRPEERGALVRGRCVRCKKVGIFVINATNSFTGMISVATADAPEMETNCRLNRVNKLLCASCARAVKRC